MTWLILRRLCLGLIQNGQVDQSFVEDNKSTIARVLTDGEPDNLVIERYEEAIEDDDEDEHHHDYVIEEKDSVALDENLSIEAKEEELIKKGAA